MIYVLAEVGERTGPVKIGYARGEHGEGDWQFALKHRLRDAQLGNHRELEVIAICAGTIEQERALHVAFSHGRVRGEWFDRTPEIHELISSCVIDPIRNNGLRFGPRMLRAMVGTSSSARAVRSTLGRAWSQIAHEGRMARSRPGKGRAKPKPTQCGICGQVGHNRRGHRMDGAEGATPNAASD